jgi:hypothetical protein
VVRLPDHGGRGQGASAPSLRPHPAQVRRASSSVDLWLATAKCATHLESARIPHAVLEQEVLLADDLLQSLCRCWPGPGQGGRQGGRPG